MPSGDARIDFEEEVSPGKGTFQSLIKTIVPFLILVLTKSIFQHFIYGLILIGLNLLAIRLNSFIIRQVQLKRQVSYVKCFYTIGLILALYSLLINLFSRIDPVDPYLSLLLTGRPRADGNLSWLVWLVIFGDTVIKLLAIGIKCIILITSSKLGCLFKRGCLLSLAELSSKAHRQLAGCQLVPFILAVNDKNNPTISESYMGYLLLFTFIGFKLFVLYGIVGEMKQVTMLIIHTPSFNHLIDSDNNCDLTVKVEVTCRDDDLLHWMSTYGTHPGTGHPIIKLPGGDGHTSMSINIF